MTRFATTLAALSMAVLSQGCADQKNLVTSSKNGLPEAQRSRLVAGADTERLSCYLKQIKSDDGQVLFSHGVTFTFGITLDPGRYEVRIECTNYVASGSAGLSLLLEGGRTYSINGNFADGGSRISARLASVSS